MLLNIQQVRKGFRMGVSIREVLEGAGYDFNNASDVRWLLGQRDNIEELLDECDEYMDLVDEYDEEMNEVDFEDRPTFEEWKKGR